MCGIVYAHDFSGQPVNNGVLNQFDKQRGRGTQGFGLFDGQEGHIVRSTTEDGILKWLCKYDSNLLLFHHRYPTSTENTKNTAHPLTTKGYFGDTEYIFVHNGHINNAFGLKAKHIKQGMVYHTVQPDSKFNDSEALMWDLSLYLEGKQEKLEAVGAMAFVCLKKVNGRLDRLYFGRNNNPLNMLKVKQGIMLSSEGVGEPIDTHTLYGWNFKTKRLTTKLLDMPTYYYSEPSENRYVVPYQYPDYYKQGGFDGWPDDHERTYRQEMEELQALDDWETDKVESLVMSYLVTNKGNYELAYNSMEFDYMQIAEDIETENFTASLYESALRYLETEEAWVNEKSISPDWLELQLELSLERSVA